MVMNSGIQDAVIRFLSRPESFGATSVERIDTHISHIFLAGERACNLKRAVKLDFLDYSTPERRRHYCERELEINRRTAPALYRGVLAVRRQPDGSLSLGGDGEAVDWLVVMRRFEQSMLLSSRASTGKIDDGLIDALGDRVAAFHRQATVSQRTDGHDALARAARYPLRYLKDFIGKCVTRAAYRALETSVGRLLDRHRGLLDRRAAGGFVRQCHGDLHLANVVLLDGQPVPFDAIEFSDDLANIDVLYDFSFLLMDMVQAVSVAAANRLLNRYLEQRRDYAGLALLPLFMTVRAIVRAMAGALRGDTGGLGIAQHHLDLAQRLTEEPRPRLIVVGGLSGSGKTTLARALASRLAPAAGAVHLSSDIIRKRMLGHLPEDRLSPEAYRPVVSRRMFERMRDDARQALDAGQVVICDATHMAPQQRREIAAVASRAGCRFNGLWLDAPIELLERRAEGRARPPSTAAPANASDAGRTVVETQATASLGDIDWPRVDASGTPDAVLGQALGLL